MVKVIKGDLILEKDTIFNESIEVKGNIVCKNNDLFNLTVYGNIKAENISARDISAGDISAWDISARDISARDISAGDISAWDISAEDISANNINYYAFCIAYKNIKCKSIKGRRENSFHKTLDGKVIFLNRKGEDEND